MGSIPNRQSYRLALSPHSAIRNSHSEFNPSPQPTFSSLMQMLSHYLRSALRSLRRHPGYAIINIGGLALSITCSLFILLFIRDELSYDRHHSHAGRIVRLVEDVHTESETLYQAASAPAMAPALAAEYPEVQRAVRFNRTGGLLRVGDRRFQEDQLVFADSTVFDVFDFPLARGDAETALVAPNSIVLTQTFAHKYFGDEDPIGQTMALDDEQVLTVTGVLGRLPRQTHLPFDAMLSFTTLEAASPDINTAWFWNSFYTYLLLSPDYEPSRLEERLPKFVERHIGDQQRASGMSYTLRLQPLTAIYLHSDRTWEAGPSGDTASLLVFGVVALFVLLVACINFINLATARSRSRAREIGLRKVVGATRWQLTVQFLGESVLTSVCAAGTSLTLYVMLLPVFNTLAGKSLTVESLGGTGMVGLLVGLALGLGLVAGSYPALALAGLRPVTTFAGGSRTPIRGAVLRNGLVVFQFAVSTILIIATLLVAVQVDYLRNRHLGFEAEQQLVLDFGNDPHIRRQAAAVKRAFRELPAVTAVSMTSSVPGGGTRNVLVDVEVGSGRRQQANLDTYMVDTDFVETFGVDVIAGRDFSDAHSTDAASYLLNEAAVRHLGWSSPEQAIGKRLGRGPRMGTIVGVVRDFNYRSLHGPVDPLFLGRRPNWMTYLTLRLETEDVAGAVADAERVWNDIVPHRPFSYFFLDAQLDQQYRADERLGNVFGIFALIAIVVACLGLFGLTVFTAEERTREIGVRKILGATTQQLVVLLTKDFVRLVAVAFVVAVPVAYVVMDAWLTGFAYHVEIPWWMFACAGSGVLAVALATTSYHTLRAALADPVESLRYE